MAIKKMRPTSDGVRHMSRLVVPELSKARPEKSLTVPLKSAYGRDNYGHRTCRDRQKGHKRLYRIIDFKRNKLDVPARVESIEYDPNRTANIALLHYADGAKAYILAPKGLKVGDVVMNGANAEIKPGNALKLKDMPVGAQIHNIELQVGRGGQLVRSAGTAARLVAK